jgi:pectate lyase
MVDHCSASWSLNEIFAYWSEENPNFNITFSWNILAEALKVHSTALIVGRNTDANNIHDIDIIYNCFANTGHRHPLIKGKQARIINNIIYNWHYYATGYNLSADDSIICRPVNIWSPSAMATSADLK